MSAQAFCYKLILQSDDVETIKAIQLKYKIIKSKSNSTYSKRKVNNNISSTILLGKTWKKESFYETPPNGHNYIILAKINNPNQWSIKLTSAGWTEEDNQF